MAGASRPVPGRWSAAAYTCLMVALFVGEPAIISLTVHDHVQLDRVTGASAERHGDLIPPGTTEVRTTGNAQVQLGQDAPVRVLAVTRSDGKDIPPDPDAQALPAAKGDSPPGHVPTLTVLR
jgi:hypothetical protein